MTKYLLGKVWRRIMPDVIVQRRIGNELFAVSLRDHALWILYGDKAAGAEKIPIVKGHVWDLGCNIGVYSIAAARAGCRVTAFDISNINVLCLAQTAIITGLPMTVVHSPVTTIPTRWTPSNTGHCEEKLSEGGIYKSLTFLEAAEKFGKPDCIKMDIQGGEVEFLQSEAFHGWVHSNGIAVYLEVHGEAVDLIWPTFTRIGPIHYWLPSTKSP